MSILARKIRKIVTPSSDGNYFRKFRCGDEILLSGTIFTARDAFHKKLFEMENAPDFLPSYSAIYHCGPIAKFAKNEKIKLIAAGPTTSWRMGLYAPKIIEKFAVRIFIGKGGMGGKFADACKKYGAIYLSFPGGCAQSALKYVCEIRKCYFLDELGPTEAVYEVKIKEMPLIVSIDSHGENLYEKIKNHSEIAAKKL